METEKVVFEWRIENLSHWRAEVHGEYIQTPEFFFPFSYVELHPKGVSGDEEHPILVRFCGMKGPFNGDLSFYSSDGSLLCSKLRIDAYAVGDLEFFPGPKFKDLLSRNREDFITVRCTAQNLRLISLTRMRTTINFLQISLKIKPGRIENIKSDATVPVGYITFSPNDWSDRLVLYACCKNNLVHFMIEQRTKIGCPFAVGMCVRLMRRDGTVDKCEMKEHVFRDTRPWTFPDPLEKKEFAGKGIFLFLFFRTKNLIQIHNLVDFENSCILGINNWYSTKEATLDPDTSKRKEVLTKDSGVQTSLPLPGDSVLELSKELMCLYQDQDFSDFQIKCGNVLVPVHKAILSARSPVFKTMLSTDMAEAASSEVDIGDLDPSTLSLFLTYLYTGSVGEKLQCERALKLYYVAEKYQVPSLKRECSDFLCSSVSISNVCDILSLADRHRDEQLTSAAHDFILSKYNDVLKSKEWESFMCREPLLAVKTVTHFAEKDRVRTHDPQ